MKVNVDGDVLNINRLITVELKREFGRILDPHTGFLIDRNNGKFNSQFGLIKDERISLYQFCII